MALAIPLLVGADKQTARTAIGLLLIVDALMGLQSRHNATLLLRGSKSDTYYLDHFFFRPLEKTEQ